VLASEIEMINTSLKWKQSLNIQRQKEKELKKSDKPINLLLIQFLKK